MHTYVGIDPSLKRIKRLQDYLVETDLQLIFIAGGISEIPYRKDSIDINICHPDYPADKLPPGKFKVNMEMNGFELQETVAGEGQLH